MFFFGDIYGRLVLSETHAICQILYQKVGLKS